MIRAFSIPMVVAWTVVFVCAAMIGSGCTDIRDRQQTAAESLRPAPFGEPVLLGHLENRNITEASGVVSSRVHPDVLWIVNDGGDAPVLYAVDMQGAHLGRVRIRNAQNVDWEDLAAFRINHVAVLLIADFGDNRARRAENALYFVREPDIADRPQGFELSADWHRRLRFVYEDGPRDCEAVAVDPERNQILLLTKRTVPPVVYGLPLRTPQQQPLMVARRIAVVENMRPPSTASAIQDSRFDQGRFQPTAMDISTEGTEIAVLTYAGGYLFRRKAHLGWSQGFQTHPEWIRMPALRQAEAICFSADGQSLIVTSEQLPAPLYRLDRISVSGKKR